MQRMWSTYLDANGQRIQQLQNPDVSHAPTRRISGDYCHGKKQLLTHPSDSIFHPNCYDEFCTVTPPAADDGLRLPVSSNKSLFLFPSIMRLTKDPITSQSSRRASIISHANSAYSQAGSTRHILADMNSNPDFANASGAPTLTNRSIAGIAPGLRPENDASSVSLSVNYIPHKFSDAMFSAAGPRRRKGFGPAVPKLGGGVEAFRSGEARMPGANDEDYDGVQSGFLGAKDRQTGQRMRWTRFKWILIAANTFVRPLSSSSLYYLTLTLSTAISLLPRRTHLLPPHLVQHLDTRRRSPSRQPSRTSLIHHRSLSRRLHLFNRLGRSPPQ